MGLKQIKNILTKEFSCSEDLDNTQASIVIGIGSSLPDDFSRFAGVLFVYFDNLIYLSDFNANYRLYHYLKNVILKCSSTQKIILQTKFPQNTVLELLSKNYAEFYKMELGVRKEYDYPPFSTLIKLFFQHHDHKICQKEAERFYKELSNLFLPTEVEINAPYLYYLGKIRKRFRYIITLKIKNNLKKIQALLYEKTPDFWSVDKNPLDLL